MKKEFVKYGFFILIALVVFVYIYPTVYRYDKYDQKIPVRINRITGKTELLYAYGWTVPTTAPVIDFSKYQSTPTPTPSPTPIPTYNGETFKQYYDRVIKEVPGETVPTKNTIYLRWERARLGLVDKLVDPKDYFTIGSTKEEVKKVMGSPNSIDAYLDRWEYDGASVSFENGKVKEYHDILSKLLVR